MLTSKDIFKIADRYCESALLQHAHAARIFDFLQEARTCTEVARQNGWLVEKTSILLDSLAALGLVLKVGLSYHNSPGSDEALVRGRPGYIGDLIEHERLQWKLWGDIDVVLRTEDAVPGQQDLNLPANEYANEVFHRAMMQLAGELLGPVAELPEWNDVRHALDLAGGHGLYLAEVAKRHPTITGEVWDSPSARRHAEAVMATGGVSDRIKFSERDIADPRSFQGVAADAAMLNHCLHHFDLMGVESIARMVASILPTNGLLTILDVHLEANRTIPAENALFSFYMMMNTVRGQVHPTMEIARVFTEAGFNIETRLLDSLEGDFLMVGRKL